MRDFSNIDRAATCDGKVKLTYEIAQEVIGRYRGKERNKTAYKCRVCRHWHVAEAVKIKRKG